MNPLQQYLDLNMDQRNALRPVYYWAKQVSKPCEGDDSELMIANGKMAKAASRASKIGVPQNLIDTVLEGQLP